MHPPSALPPDPCSTGLEPLHVTWSLLSTTARAAPSLRRFQRTAAPNLALVKINKGALINILEVVW